MTDDSTAEREALQSSWKSSTLLLCMFHFLQRRWTWLHDGKHRIQQKDRLSLMKMIKALVYSKSEIELKGLYGKLKSNEIAIRYPHFLQHIQSLWPRRHDWALCYRRAYLTRGNHTNNYAEAGIKIVKDLIFSRIKAYNLTQMFAFISESMELYYQRKLLNVSNSRMDNFVAGKFLGKGAETVQQNTIESLGDGVFRMKSRRRLTGHEDDSYIIDTHIGTCSCKKGQDGSPCAHQAAVVSKYKTDSVNCFPSLSVSARHQIAKLAIGDKANTDINFYASLHQEDYDTAVTEMSVLPNTPDLATLRAKLLQDTDNQNTSMNISHPHQDSQLESPTDPTPHDLQTRLRAITDDLITKLDTEDQQFRDGVKKFIKRYESLQGPRSIARLSSALHQFDWAFGGHSVLRHGIFLQRGKRIPVQATSAGRRKYGSKGKGKTVAGRPVYALSLKPKNSSHFRYTIPQRKKNQNKGKGIHSLKLSIEQGRQNAGKW